MKNRRTLAILLALVMVLALFAGCKNRTEDKNKNAAELTAADVVKNCYEKMKGLKSCNSDITLDADIHLSQDGMNMDIAADADLTGGMHTDPMDFHYAGTVKLDAGETGSEEIALDVIGKTEDGKLALYYWTDTEDQYTRQEVEIEESDVNVDAYVDLAKDLAWEMKTTDSSYVLTYTLTKEDSGKIFDEAIRLAKEQDNDLEVPEEFEDMKGLLEGLKFTLTVDKERMYLTALDLDLSAVLTGQMPDIISMFFGAFGDEEVNIDLTGSTCCVNVKFRDFDAAAEINAPENYVDADDWDIDFDDDDYDDDDWDWDIGETLEALDDSVTVGDFSFYASEVTVRDLLDAGWTVKEAYDSESFDDLESSGNMIAPGSIGVINLVPAGWTGEDEAMSIETANATDADVSYLDCPVYSLDLNYTAVLWGDYESNVPFSTGYGVGYGDDIQKAIEAIGEPFSTMEAEDEDDYGVYVWVTEDGATMGLITDYSGTIRGVQYTFDNGIS